MFIESGPTYMYMHTAEIERGSNLTDSTYDEMKRLSES